MLKIFKPLAVAAVLAGMLIVTPSADARPPRRSDGYWNNYWSWYDRDYRGYYNRRNRRWNRDRNRDWNYRSRYDFYDPYDYGWNRNRYRYYGRPYTNGIQIGPVGIGWR